MSVDDVVERLDQAGRSKVTMPEYGTVRAVNADGTVTVEMGRGEVNSVPASRSYWPRAVDDVVLVIEARQGPVVLCAIGAGGGTGITVSNDPPPVGQGWEAVNVFTRAGQLWGDRVTAAPSTGTTVTATASILSTYRSGSHLRDSVAEQGTSGGYPMHTGLVIFPAGSFAAISGLTAQSGKVEMHRRDTSHGQVAATAPTLWRASYASPPATTPTKQDGSWLGPALRRNETGHVSPSGAWLQPFCAGTANALVIYTTIGADNVEMDSLTLTITAT